jgi:hypothetical protein
VRFNDAGDPMGVERLGIALEPEADYELRPGGGGCEDPRVTFVEPLKRYIMTYTAFSSDGTKNCDGRIRGSLPLEDGLDSRLMLIGMASNWAMWTIRMRASFQSPYLTRPENWNWVCSIGRYLQAPIRRRLPPPRKA